MNEQSPTDYKVQLGERLEVLRRRHGLDRKAVAKVLHCSESKIVKIERGDVGVIPLELIAMLDLFEVGGEEREDLLHLGDEARRRRPKTPWGSAIPDRLRKMFNIEESAVEIRSYSPELVHGLVQTEDYARAIIQTNSRHRPEDVERLVQARMARQTRLTSKNPPRLDLVLSEAAIRIVVGGRGVMREQLQRLIEVAHLPFMTLRIASFEGGAHAATGYPFTLLTPPARKKIIAYVEYVTEPLYIDDSARVATCERVFSELAEAVLSPEVSLKLLTRVAAEL
jgi:transcriptional regulator with XRE-family HTH domain